MSDDRVNGDDNVKHCAGCGRAFTPKSKLYTVAIEEGWLDPMQITPLLQYSIVCRKCFLDLLKVVYADHEPPDEDYKIEYDF